MTSRKLDDCIYISCIIYVKETLSVAAYCHQDSTLMKSDAKIKTLVQDCSL